MLTGWILCQSCAVKCSCWEFMSTTVLSCSEDAISFEFSSTSGSYNLPIFLFMMVPGLWEKSCDMDLSCPFVAEHSKTLVLYTSSSYVSTSNSVRKKFLWWRLRAAPICVYRAMNLEVSLIVWLFSRIIVIGSPLRILSFTTMIFFWPYLQYLKLVSPREVGLKSNQKAAG